MCLYSLTIGKKRRISRVENVRMLKKRGALYREHKGGADSVNERQKDEFVFHVKHIFRRKKRVFSLARA